MQKSENLSSSLGVRQKVLIVLMTVLLFALTASGWFALQQEKKSVQQEINQRGSDIARFVAKSLAYSVVGYDYQTIQLLLNEITHSEEIDYAQVTNKRKKEMGVSGVINSVNKEHIKIFTEEIKLENEVVGELKLALSTVKVLNRLEANKYSLITREAIIAILEFTALSFIIIRPVKAISQSLEEGIENSGKMVENIPVNSGDEFGQLASKFNKLGADLNRANEKLQQKIEAADFRLIENNSQLLKQQYELEKINQELHKMAITDSLTGLFNRRHFEELITSEMSLSMRHGDWISMVMIDIDKFKPINDTYGHFSGDIVLKTVADTLALNLRKTDVLCRIGGEEFVVLCKRADKNDTSLIAEKLRIAIEDKVIRLGKDVIEVTISLGGATVPDARKTSSIDEFYRLADTALYFSKDHGRNCYYHFDDLSAQDLKDISFIDK